MAENNKNINNSAESKEVASKKAETKATKSQDKKPNIFVRLGKKIKKLCRDLGSEMKKVVWLSKSETKKSSVLVIVTVIAIAAAIGVVDTAFSTVINFIAGLIG